MEEDKINTMEVHRDLNIENKPVLLPEENKQIIIQTFLLGHSSTPSLMKGTTGDTLPPPTFPSLAFNNMMASDAVGRSIIQLAENQSHSLYSILAGQQSQMDAYRDMFQPGKGG